jgi:hypothetical protein
VAAQHQEPLALLVVAVVGDKDLGPIL